MKHKRKEKLLTGTTYALPEELRRALRRPLGDLVEGSEVPLGRLLESIIKNSKPTRLILVGDSVSRETTRAGITPDVMVIDYLEKRQRATAYAHPHTRVITAKNAAGRIEPNARMAVERAIGGEADLVVIEGEEDLLAIVAVIAAPLGSLVVYGQPNEGVVLVRVSEEKKKEAEGILKLMQRVNDD